MKLLRTKYFTAQYENGTIRQIKSGKTEIVRMIYPSVRDHNWETVEPELVTEKITRKINDFQIDCVLRFNKNDIHFEIDCRLIACGNRLIYNMSGEAKSNFLSNRTGFCVLHPIKECAGQKCQINHPDESFEAKTFPEQIAAHQPMKNISKMKWNPADNIRAQINFAGEVFEMEDQRNWTDASYKTYCRPLDLLFPFEIYQKIELEIKSEPFLNEKEDIVSLRIDRNRVFEIPEIGICNTSRKEEITMREAGILKKLPLQHLRVELKLFSENWEADFQRAIAESEKLDLNLFLVICLSGEHKKEIQQFASFVPVTQLHVSQILVVGENHLPDDAIFDAAFGGLKNLFPNAKIGSGVNAYFAELNRKRPQTKNSDFISFTISPQVHAFDNFSLAENMEAQKYVVESAKNLFPRKPIYVSPVTLKQRYNVVATSDEPPLLPGELPPQVDLRQNTIFAAQWLLGSLKYLAQAGADLLTFFETVGWRGFIQGDFNPPLPERFSAKKGDAFPIYHLLKEFKDFDQLVYSESNSPLEIDGIVLKQENNASNMKYKILLANFSDQQKKVGVPGLHDIKVSRNLLGQLSIKASDGTVAIPSNEIVILDLP